MRDDTGAAIPEFIVVAVGIMIPLAYVLIALADVLGARSAAQSAVREASRVYSRDISSISGEYRARQAAQIAFADRHLDLPEESLTFHCSLGG